MDWVSVSRSECESEIDSDVETVREVDPLMDTVGAKLLVWVAVSVMGRERVSVMGTDTV